MNPLILSTIALTLTLANPVAQAEITQIFSCSRMAHSLSVLGDALIIPDDAQNQYRVFNYKTLHEESPIKAPEPASLPYDTIQLSTGDLIGFGLDGNHPIVIDKNKLASRQTLDLSGYQDASGFNPYTVTSGCSMPNGDVYFVSKSDSALVKIAQGKTQAELIATYETAGLSGSKEVACAAEKLFVINEHTDVSKSEILVLNTSGKVLQKLAVPGLFHLTAQDNQLVLTILQIDKTQKGAIAFADASAENLKITTQVTNDAFVQSIAFDLPRNRLWVAEKFPPAITSYDLKDLKPLSHTAFSGKDQPAVPRGIAVSPDGTEVFVESGGSIWSVK